MCGADGWSRRGIMGAGLALAAAPARAAAGPVRTAAGDFVGTEEGGVRAFRGIRYGRAERFRAPIAFAAPGQRIAADAFGPACPQGSRQAWRRWPGSPTR